jgi:hypothetical protein
MTEQALPPPSRYPWLVPVAIFVVVLAALAGVIVLARQAGQSDAPPEPPKFQLPQILDYAAYDVEAVSGTSMRLSSGTGKDVTTIEVPLAPDTRIWLLQPVTAADLKPPLVFNAVSVTNEVRNYAITLFAFAPAQANQSADGLIPLADGFYGYETSRDTTERAVVSGILTSFDGRNGVTQTASGPGTLYVDAGAPVRLLRKGTAAEISPSDRVALHLDASGKPDPSKGVLVLTATN